MHYFSGLLQRIALFENRELGKQHHGEGESAPRLLKIVHFGNILPPKKYERAFR